MRSLKKVLLFVFTLFVILFFGCSYSFTGASVPEHLNTVYIPICGDQSNSGEPTLRDDFTNELIKKFRDDNSLQVTDGKDADAIVECVILSISEMNSMITGNETVKTNKITLNVKVVYKDLVKKTNIFDQNFTNYGDYVPGTGINDRQPAIETALDKISEDILLAAVSGW